MSRKRKLSDENISVVRISEDSLRFFDSSKTKGVFYYTNKDGAVLIDNRQNKMVKYVYESIEKLIQGLEVI